MEQRDLKTKQNNCKVYFNSVLTYSPKPWILTKTEISKIQPVNMKFLRSSGGKTWIEIKYLGKSSNSDFVSRIRRERTAMDCLCKGNG
jgi:hypothetical protein